MTMSGQSTPPVPPPPPTGRRRVPVGSIVLIVAGALIVLLAALVGVGGGALVWAHTTQRDADGYYTTSTQRFETTSYALTSTEIDLGSSRRETPVDLGHLGTIRIRAERTTPGAVFIGIASQQDVDAYLSTVSHARIERLRFDPFSVEYRYEGGGAPARPPGRSDIWVASADGPGQQTLQWAPRSGEWAVVVMNADGSAGVSVDASAGAKTGWLLGVGIGLIAGGLVGFAFGAVLLVLGVLGLSRGDHIDLTSPEPVAGQAVRLEGRLSEPLSRWLWLVKWVLLIPHLVVLAVLWVVFTVVTVIAFFAILFTERYPRSLFDFNVGVLRWTWRVTYYGYSALGTDRYPPFSLGHAPDYPATLEIAYPERLSRGLVLIKWWLLAIPQYLVLTLFGGGIFIPLGRFTAAVSFGGLIGLLVLFAGVALLFAGRYPSGIFDLVMGLNRWVYRVVAYVSLMRDDYPPFRLDQGGAEPTAPAPPLDQPSGGATAVPAAASGVSPTA